jgi:hemoglobin/transferrin/lactoferrin receptor protein
LRDGRRAKSKDAIFAAASVAALIWATQFAAIQSAGAQEGSAADEGEEAADVITVYGTANPLPVFDYPGQVTVITREDIESLAPSAMSDLMRDVPGVEFSGGPRRTGEVPALRGLSGENVLILLDGARQSFISAHDGRFFVDPELLRSAEAVRGPASALYGSGAVGGVLAFETVDAADLLDDDETYGVRLRAGYQDVADETLLAATGFARQGALDLLASFGVRDSGDITLGDGYELPSDDDIETSLVKAGFDVADGFNVEASWQRFVNEALEPNNGQGVALSADPILGADVFKDITSDTYRLGAAFTPAGNDLIDASFTAYRSDSEVEEYDESLDRTTTREIETTGLSGRNASRFMFAGADAIFTVGGDWYRDEQTGRDDATMSGDRGGVPNGEAEFYGVFAQLELSVENPLGAPGELLVIPGVRYDRFESSSEISPDPSEDEAVSPRLAASYGPNDWFRVFASYSEGFRAPSINELYLDGVHFEVPHPILFDPTGTPPSFVFVANNFIANPNLMPEEASTVEFGAGVDFDDVFMSGDRFQAKASYFDSEIENLINLSVDFAYDVTCFSPPFFPCTAGTTNSANLDAGELSGFEAEAIYDSNRFRIRGSFSSIEGEDSVTGADLGTLTPNRLAVDARVKLPEWRAAVGARVQMADDFEQRDGMGAVFDERPGYVVGDIYATWRPAMLEGVRIDVGVDNVLDHTYERVFEGVTEPGRNAKIAVSWQAAR